MSNHAPSSIGISLSVSVRPWTLVAALATTLLWGGYVSHHVVAQERGRQSVAFDESNYTPAAAERIRRTHVSLSRGADGRLSRPASRPRSQQPTPAASPSPRTASKRSSQVRTSRAQPTRRASTSSTVVRPTTAEAPVEVQQSLEPIPVEMAHGGVHPIDAAPCGAGCGGCNSCAPVCVPCFPICNRLWIRGEYLHWWTSGNPVPPLVTQSPDGTLREDAGVLGEPGTTVLFGGDDLNTDERPGVRATLGYWLDPCQCWGIEFSYAVLEDETAFFTQQSNGSPILARPFFNVETNMQDSELVAFPDVLTGRVTVDAVGEFETGSVLLRRMLLDDCCGRLDFLIGYRNAQLNDRLRIVENLVSIDTGIGIEPGTRIDLFDQFDTDNDFNGIDLGVHGRWKRRKWTFELLMKLALGNTRSTTTINGSTTSVTPDGTTATNAGGLLAQPTNIGVYENNEFAVMPEIGVSLHYDLTCRWRASAGYTFLYWSNVMRSGEQIDFGLNLSQLPPGPLTGAPQPQFREITTDFWAQGLTFGLEYQF